MEPIKDFCELMASFRSMSQPKKIVVVSPDDAPSVEMLNECLKEKLAEFYLVVYPGHDEQAVMLAKTYPGAVTVISTDDINDAARKGVELVRTSQADVLMKGNINTDNLLRAVLDHECGLLPKGNVLSHVALAEIPGYDRLIAFSDAAVIPHPDLTQFQAMVRYDVAVVRKLGVACPRVALVHFTEKVNEKFRHTLDYVALKQMAAEQAFGDVCVGGPMDVKTACDAHSGAIKGIASPVVGNADVIIFPDLVAANTFYKTISCFCKARMAGILTGTSAPVVIPSRADAPESKLYSLALACVMAEK